MILQLSEIKYPLPKKIAPGDLTQWAAWYVRHLLNGGKRLEGP